MTVDIEKLEALAKAATPGKWQAYDTHGKRFIESMIGEAHIVCEKPKKQWLKDSEFIAAANPAAVLELIAECNALRKDAERYRWLEKKSHPIDYDGGMVSVYSLPRPERSNCGCPGMYPSFHHETLGEAIDAAITKESGQ